MSDSSANSAQDLYDAYMLCRIAKLKMPEPDIAKERDRFVNDLISKIQSGNDNDDEATILIEYLNYCLAQYCPHLPEPLLRYFGDAFGQIGMGVDSGRALNLKPKQKDGAKNSRDSSRRKRFYFRRDLHWYLSLKSLMTHEGLSFENV